MEMQKVGAWGPGPFDNDAALDFVADLRRNQGADSLREELAAATVASPLQELNWSIVERGIAAAEIVAAVHGAAGSALPEDGQAWVDAHANVNGGLLKLAQQAVERVRAEMPSLKRSWFEVANADDWERSVLDLQRRLSRMNG